MIAVALLDASFAWVERARAAGSSDAIPLGRTDEGAGRKRGAGLPDLPDAWGHATLNLEEGLAAGGFLQDELSLGLHMQVVHAPRGVGSLQNAATWAGDWYERVARAFPAAA